MQFDTGGEIFVKFRFRGTEAARGEDVRDAALKKIQEFFGPDSYIRIERSWFEATKPEISK